MSEHADAPVVSNFYTLSYDLGNGRNMQINGNFYTGQTPDEKFAALRETVGIVERQRAAMEIPLLEAQLKQLEKNREDLPQILENELSPLLGKLDEAYKQQSALKGREKNARVEMDIANFTASKEARLKKHKQDIEGIAAGIKEANETIAQRRKFVLTGIED